VTLPLLSMIAYAGAKTPSCRFSANGKRGGMPISAPSMSSCGWSLFTARTLVHIPINRIPLMRAIWFTALKRPEAGVARFDLTDFELSVIQPLLPMKVRGVKRADDWRVLSGIFWRLRTGAPWADIPARDTPHKTCVDCFNRWRRAGHWVRIPAAVSEAYDGVIQMIDSPSIRVHQHAANGQEKPSNPVAWVARAAG
jgi:transposase